MTVIDIPLFDRIEFEVDKNGCWIWTAGLTKDGYGKLWGQGAHRIVYEAVVERIPDGLQLDHLCRVRACVNPDHLEPVTPRENTLRGETPGAANAAKTHCPQGHEYPATSGYYRNGGRKRRCPTCEREAARRRERKKRGIPADHPRGKHFNRRGGDAQ